MGVTVCCSELPNAQQAVKVELMPSEYVFNTSGRTAQSTLTAQIPQTTVSAPDDIKKGFSLKFTVEPKQFNSEETILEIPQTVVVRLRQHDAANRDRQNYPAFKMPDGSVPVLEASIRLKLYPDKEEIQDMTIGIPLAMLDDPVGKHEVILNFSGVCWTMYVDGKLLDNDFALGYPLWSEKSVLKINPNYIHQSEIYFPALQTERLTTKTPEIVPEIQYWTPSGHNSWVGDVATFYHQGRYHVFYLYDRRHHASKFGRGAHYFEHLSTADFKTWVEHQAATPIEEQWETFGTGTPFVFEGKLCISYGLHTTRIYPGEKTNLPAQWEYLQKNGRTGKFHFDLTENFPAGATYSVSEDGISKFKKTGIIFHPCENPSVFIDPEGKLKLLANYQSRGTWESENMDSGWHCVNKDFPPGGDCTFFFRWGKFDYIIGGFVNLWSKPVGAPDSEYRDLVARGLDCYDGLGVPAISEISGGRFLMAGWMPVHGWGGPLIIRELIQFPDGRIGTKWMDEITPETKKSNVLKDFTFGKMLNTSESFMLTFRVIPGKQGGKFGVIFAGEKEQNACELQINPDEKRAQFASGSFNDYSDRAKSLREGGSNGLYNSPGAIENLIATDKPFIVRVIVKGTDKLGGSLIDAEIAGKRTMIVYRPELFVKQLMFRADGVEINDVKIENLINYE
jgi:hypothetical protein